MKNLLHKIGAGVSVLPVLLLPAAALAQIENADDELTTIGKELGTAGQADPLPVLIGRIIALLLSLLGIIFVVLIVYAGFLYMTAAGDDAKVKKAKQLIIQAIIGLVIIVAAYAISAFVVGSLANAVAGT